jgi:hypothetical protein
MELPIIRKVDIDGKFMYGVGFSDGILWWGLYNNIIQATIAYIKHTTKYIIRQFETAN